MYYGARYYDPAIGRFAQPDSLIADLYNPQSLNRYSYALNNPVRYTDPTGHSICEEADCRDPRASLARAGFLRDQRWEWRWRYTRADGERAKPL